MEIPETGSFKGEFIVMEAGFTDDGLQILFQGQDRPFVLPLSLAERRAILDLVGQYTPGSVLRVSRTEVGVGIERLSQG